MARTTPGPKQGRNNQQQQPSSAIEANVADEVNMALLRLRRDTCGVDGKLETGRRGGPGIRTLEFSSPAVLSLR